MKENTLVDVSKTLEWRTDVWLSVEEYRTLSICFATRRQRCEELIGLGYADSYSLELAELGTLQEKLKRAFMTGELREVRE